MVLSHTWLNQRKSMCAFVMLLCKVIAPDLHFWLLQANTKTIQKKPKRNMTLLPIPQVRPVHPSSQVQEKFWNDGAQAPCAQGEWTSHILISKRMTNIFILLVSFNMLIYNVWGTFPGVLSGLLKHMKNTHNGPTPLNSYDRTKILPEAADFYL